MALIVDLPRVCMDVIIDMFISDDDYVSICRLLQVSKRVCEWVSHSSVWKRLIRIKWPSLYDIEDLSLPECLRIVLEHEHTLKCYRKYAPNYRFDCVKLLPGNCGLVAAELGKNDSALKRPDIRDRIYDRHLSEAHDVRITDFYNIPKRLPVTRLWGDKDFTFFSMALPTLPDVKSWKSVSCIDYDFESEIYVFMVYGSVDRNGKETLFKVWTYSLPEKRIMEEYDGEGFKFSDASVFRDTENKKLHLSFSSGSNLLAVALDQATGSFSATRKKSWSSWWNLDLFSTFGVYLELEYLSNRTSLSCIRAHNLGFEHLVDFDLLPSFYDGEFRKSFCLYFVSVGIDTFKIKDCLLTRRIGIVSKSSTDSNQTYTLLKYTTTGKYEILCSKPASVRAIMDSAPFEYIRTNRLYQVGPCTVLSFLSNELFDAEKMEKLL